MKKQLLLAVLITATDAVAAQICQDNPAFTEKTAISTAANGARSVYAADVDGDGDLDVLSASALDDKIAWYKNDGAGNFTAQTAISTTADLTFSVYAADVDGDGDVDVLSASANDDKIAWYKNDGAGNFTAQPPISTSADFAVSVYAADVDGDGDLDVLSASADDDKIAWYKNDGAGNFTAEMVISTAADAAFSVYAADVDGDGDLDVLSASVNDDKIAWYQNDGAGNFTAQTAISTTANEARSVYAADVDGDGDVDVLSASANDDKIAWYKNDGAGNFTAQTPISTTADGALSVYAADVDGDGDLDVLSASFNDDKIAWYKNDGAGNFTAQTPISTTANFARSVYAADVDGDGDLDVLSASADDDKIAWYENTCARCANLPTFVTQAAISTSADGGRSVYAADVDGDGDLDVLSASALDDKIAWYKNDGAGNFTAQMVISTTADFAVSVYAADVDGDGDVDVLSASRNDNKIAWYKNDGAGNFTAQTAISTTANGAQSVYAADVDGDGDVDVLSASFNDDKIAWYQNDGAGNFTAEMVISTAADAAFSVYAADVDGDGDLDVLSASSNDNKIAWYKNDGAGNFTAQTAISTAADGALSVYAADLDGDGDVDVLSASRNDDKIAWYQNDGAGNFTAQTAISTSADAAQSVYAADVDGDGDVDVLSASSNDDKIAWYQNDGAGNFTAQTPISTSADFAVSVYAADVDGDGDMDVLSASQSDDKIAWYENTCVVCEAMLSGTRTICAGGTANLVVTVTQGTGPYTIGIDNNGDLTADITVPNYTSGDNIPVTPGATTTYTLLSVTDSGSGNAMCSVSGTATVTVNSVTAGTVAADETICSGGNPVAFTSTTAGSGSGTITYRWESSTTGCGSGFTTIGGATSATYDAPSGLTVTTYYRRITISTLNGVACEAISNCLTVTVNDVVAGAIAADQTICSGGDPVAFTSTTAGSGSGTITYRWESSTVDCGGGFAPIGGATSATYDVPSGLTVTTYFRRITISTLNSVACEAISNCVTVTVNDVVAGAIAADQTICAGGDPAAFTSTTAGSGSGTITYRWESSITNCNTGFTAITNTNSATYDVPSGLTVTTYYRRITISTLNGVACEAISNCLTVTVNDVTAGAIAADQTICSGGNPVAFTSTTAGSGSGTITYRWESSTTNCNTGFTAIANTNSATYDVPSGLTVTTYYRRITISTLNGVACEAISNCLTVTVNDVTAGAIAADQTICSGGDPVAFTSTTAGSGSGTITYRWESSTTNCNTGFTAIANTNSATYDVPSGLTVTTYYRRITISTLNGVACEAISNCLTVTVNDVAAGAVAADQTICSGGNPVAFTSTTAGSGSGTITYRWESSTTNCNTGFTAIINTNSATYDVPSGLTVTTYYRRITISTLNGVACEAISNCLTVTVNDITPGSIAGTQTVCITKDPAPFTSVTTATGSGVITYQWESSTTDCTQGFTPVQGATAATFDPAKREFKVTTFFRRRAISTLNGVPCDAVSNCITLTVLNVDCGLFPWNGN